MASAAVTDHIGLLVMDVHLLKLFLCCIHIMLQIRVEIAHNGLPLDSAILHAVKKPFHSRGEIHIHNTWKCLLHNAVYHFTKLCHIQVALLLGNIAAADNGGNGWRIGTWTSDSKLLHGLNQGSLCIMCRRLGKMLLRL